VDARVTIEQDVGMAEPPHQIDTIVLVSPDKLRFHTTATKVLEDQKSAPVPSYPGLWHAGTAPSRPSSP
jgi:hypothetical protein